MSSGDEYDDDLTMLEDVFDGSQYHTRINRMEALYKIRYHIKLGQAEWRG